MSDVNVYESQKLVDEYLLFHYADPQDQISWSEGPHGATGFPQRVARHLGESRVARALDVGAAVGRSSYELSRHAQEVISIDYSAAFIAAAQKLREKGQLVISRHLEGHLCDEITVLEPAQGHPSRISFQVGDAMDLPKSLGTFDWVLAANLLCRLPDPRVFLRRLPSLVRPGGTVVLATPCTWLSQFTAPHHWPEAATLDLLKAELAADFDLVMECDEPFLIRETARKFQWTSSLVTKWHKR